MTRGQWVYAGARGGGGKLSVAEKLAITAECEKLIASVLIPRFLPKIRPTEFNYPIAIYGKWHGNKYRFITRFRSDHPNSIRPEFEAPVARLEYVGRDRFDVSYYRHTGEWFRLLEALSLTEALDMLQRDGHFHPC
jgi:hypothetical protein